MAVLYLVGGSCRLLLPFTQETSLVRNLFRGIDYAVQRNTNGQTNRSLLPDTDFAEQETPFHSPVNNTTEESPKQETSLAQTVWEVAVQNSWLICGAVWLIVAVGLLIRKIMVYQSFVTYIKAGCREITDIRLWEQLGKLVEQAGIKRTVECYTNKLISSLLLLGFFHPCIIFPFVELTDCDLENTILHELTHYKRRDMCYKWVVQVTICIHWFNPIVYIMGKEINRACEFSCDETIIRKWDKQGKRCYGETLLNTLNQGGNTKIHMLVLH